MKCLQITISGDIHGNGLRFSIMQKAYELRIYGYTQYLSERDLLVECEGEEENMDQFIEWCRTGPLTIFISGLIFCESTLKGYESFTIRKGFEVDGTKVVWPSESAVPGGFKGWLCNLFKS